MLTFAFVESSDTNKDWRNEIEEAKSVSANYQSAAVELQADPVCPTESK